MLFTICHPADRSAWDNWITMPDTKSYVNFSVAIYNNIWDVFPLRLPGYPVVLMLTRTIFQYEWLGTIILQQFVSLLSAILLYRIARKFTDRFSYFVPVIFLFEPFTLIFSYSLLPEVFMVFMQITSFVLLYEGQLTTERRKMFFVFFSGLTLCLGVFFKPILLYAFVIYIPYIIFFYKDSIVKKIVLISIFVLAVQLPIHFYRQFIEQKFGIYALTRQEFSEKAGRAIDIKYLVEHNRVMHPDSLRAEIRRTLINSGFDYKRPDNRLYVHVIDSIAKTNARKYASAVLYYSFSESYMFFQPAAQPLYHFLRLQAIPELPQTAMMKEKIEHTLMRLSHPGFVAVFVLSISYSLLMLFPFVFAIVSKNLRSKYSSLLYFGSALFLYSSVMCGRIAQARYRVTFIWLFALISGLVIAYFIENGSIKNIFDRIRFKLRLKNN